MKPKQNIVIKINNIIINKIYKKKILISTFHFSFYIRNYIYIFILYFIRIIDMIFL